MIRTGFSFRTAYGHIGDVMSRIQEIGWKVAPIADRSSTFGFVQWTKLAQKALLRPIYGVELAVVVERGQRGKKRTADYWTFLAKDNLIDLHSLIGDATEHSNVTEGELPYEDAVAAKGVIRIIGPCALPDHIGKPRKDLYWGLSPATSKIGYKHAKAKGFQFIAMMNNLYPRPTDRQVYQVALGFNSTNNSYPQYIIDDKEWNRQLAHIPEADRKEALKNREIVFQQCQAKLDPAQMFVPEKKQTLRQMCEEGAKKKNINLNNKIYAARLAKELKLIAEKKFEDYFYIITDIVSWAKEHMIVGPARGSSCGSLVCYLLDITTVDPISFELIFERFIDITRSDLPDIDLDFSEDKREMAFEYIERKYGRAHVARLGTVGTFQPRSILRAVGPVLKIPQWKLNKIADMMVFRAAGDDRATQLEATLTGTEPGKKLLQEFPMVAKTTVLEGHPTNAGQHAAGICITKQPIANYVAIDRRNYVTHCNKEDAADLNMLKIDVLGLTQLSIFERTLELTGQVVSSDTLDAYPLDDEKAFDIFNQQRYSGIFQFNGRALQSLAKQITIENIDDIIILTALARPGPLDSGGAQDWVNRRNGAEIKYIHPAFEPFLEDTLGVIVYQEQVMQIARELGDLSWEEVTGLRKAMSKSMGAEYLNKWGDRWKAGAIKKGIDKKKVDHCWNDLCLFGAYGFNKSHAVAYGLVSYYCAYLKARHQIQFAAATLDFEKLPLNQIAILRELKQDGIGYKSVDKYRSTIRWEIEIDKNNNQYLLGPLTNIKGIGVEKAKAILENRNGRDGESTMTKGLLKLFNTTKTPIDSLYPIKDKVKMIKKEDVPSFTPINEIEAGSGEAVTIIGVLTRISESDENTPEKIERRGFKAEKGRNLSLNLFVRDDTDEIFVKIHRDKFETMAKKIVDETKIGNTIYKIKGQITAGGNFRMIYAGTIEHIGELEDVKEKQDAAA